MTGRVYLVGAGPGDPGLITRRGLELLRRADVVLYDRLVAPELLGEAPEGAERIFVGKRPGELHSRQIVIDALLIERARAGATVVRLKGGDPFVFGRGGEEAELLVQSGIPFEVVPGVTSAIAVPAYAGIPVTHRGMSSSFAVVTAHEATEAPTQGPRWREVVDADTVVMLMGLGALRTAARRLIEAGRDPSQPTALIQWGTTPRQRTVVATLSSIADEGERAGIGPPTIAVAGDVVNLRDVISWYETRPLFGRAIVVTRAMEQAAGLGVRLAELGAEVIEFPVISIADPIGWDDVDRAIKLLAEGHYRWVVFNSVNGIERFMGRVRHTGHDARAFARAKIAAVGPASRDALDRHNITADLVPSDFTADALAGALGHGSGTVLLPRVEGAPHDMVRALEHNGWSVEEVVAYRNLPAPMGSPVGERVRSGNYDIVTFTSASTVRNFVALAGRPEGKVIACIGPQTAGAALDLGLEVSVIADPHTHEGLVSGLVDAARTSVR